LFSFSVESGKVTEIDDVTIDNALARAANGGG